MSIRDLAINKPCKKSSSCRPISKQIFRADNSAGVMCCQYREHGKEICPADSYGGQSNRELKHHTALSLPDAEHVTHVARDDKCEIRAKDAPQRYLQFVGAWGVRAR